MHRRDGQVGETEQAQEGGDVRAIRGRAVHRGGPRHPREQRDDDQRAEQRVGEEAGIGPVQPDQHGPVDVDDRACHRQHGDGRPQVQHPDILAAQNGGRAEPQRDDGEAGKGDVPVGAQHERAQRAPVAARGIIGGEIRPDGLEPQRQRQRQQGSAAAIASR